MAGSFSIALQGFEKKAGQKMKQTIQKISMEAFKRIIMRSPVDTGRFRANWGCSIGSPFSGISDATDKSGGATASNAAATVTGWNAQGSVFLCNNLPYSIVLEYGHSQQAPAGMVRVTITEMGGVVREAAK